MYNDKLQMKSLKICFSINTPITLYKNTTQIQMRQSELRLSIANHVKIEDRCQGYENITFKKKTEQS